MIGTIDVEIMAANPSMPLFPVRAYVNSPSSVRLRNVPKKIGNWNITSVQIVAAYPDGSIKTANCVLTGGIWVGTIEGCPISGRSENGFTVFASGIDENGNHVSNYVLGKGLIEILQADGTITPDAPSYYVHLFGEEPATPKDGDLWQDTYGNWQLFYNNMTQRLDENAAIHANEAYNIAEVANGKANDLQVLVPAQASSQNKLADKAFVNSSVQTATANFRGNWAEWQDVPVDASLYPADYAGSRTPTVNDYMVVQNAVGYVPFGSAEIYEGTWRFKYSGVWSESGRFGWLPEYQVNETPMTAAQLAAINSNITAAKVATYDEAMTKFNYALSTITPTEGDMYVLPSIFPVAHEEAEPFTVYPENVTITYDSGTGKYALNDTAAGHPSPVCYINADGTFYSSGPEITDLVFNGQSPTPNVTPVIGRTPQYALLDRTVNTISITSSNSTLGLTFPSVILGKARDFIVRVVASNGTYSITPTFSISGATLMNADGEMPIIATDQTDTRTTLFYFSEIASNIYLCKGEQLEAITL